MKIPITRALNTVLQPGILLVGSLGVLAFLIFVGTYKCPFKRLNFEKEQDEKESVTQSTELKNSKFNFLYIHSFFILVIS